MAQHYIANLTFVRLVICDLSTVRIDWQGKIQAKVSHNIFEFIYRFLSQAKTSKFALAFACDSRQCSVY